MPYLDGSAPRDLIVALAWAVATLLFKASAAAGRLLHPLQAAAQDTPAPNGEVATVGRLVHVAERVVWRCETLAALQSSARAAIAAAEEDYVRLLAECAEAGARLPPAAAPAAPASAATPLAA
jgi:hypothetical protein